MLRHPFIIENQEKNMNMVRIINWINIRFRNNVKCTKSELFISSKVREKPFQNSINSFNICFIVLMKIYGDKIIPFVIYKRPKTFSGRIDPTPY
jgi:hypothetical protein